MTEVVHSIIHLNSGEEWFFFDCLDIRAAMDEGMCAVGASDYRTDPDGAYALYEMEVEEFVYDEIGLIDTAAITAERREIFTFDVIFDEDDDGDDNTFFIILDGDDDD